MSKIIPIFYLPKKYPEDMRVLVEGLVANNGQTVKAALSWLSGKLLAHSGKKAGSPMAEATIKNYLAGFYVLDLFKADGNLYSETSPRQRASVSVKSKIEVAKPALDVFSKYLSIELFEESLTQLCTESSQICRDYNCDRLKLHEKYQLEENPEPSKLKELLEKHCGYSYVGNPGVGYLDLFYRDKVQIDNYIKLMEVILNNYGDYAKENLGLVPIDKILNSLKYGYDYVDEEIQRFLIKLRITNRIELRMTKTQLAKNLGIELVDIQGVKYGFLKIVDYSLAS